MCVTRCTCACNRGVADNHFVPSVHLTNEDGLAVKAYIASASGGATASIGAGSAAPAQGSVMAAFSSRGPNGAAGDGVKPDLTAPRVVVLAGNTPASQVGAPGQLFQAISGTSMSTPHVAGVAALLRDAHPDWSPATIRSALMTSGRQNVTKEDGTTNADPFDVGGGHIVPTPAADPGLVYGAGFIDYLRFLCGTRALNPSGSTCSTSGSIDPSDLNLPSIGIDGLPGIQTATRTVTNVGPAGTYTVAVEEPAGIDMTVAPNTLVLGEGVSAAYTVTFETEAACGEGCLDTWSFGSLTWNDGDHAVRSPIAVKPVTLGPR